MVTLAERIEWLRKARQVEERAAGIKRGGEWSIWACGKRATGDHSQRSKAWWWEHETGRSSNPMLVTLFKIAAGLKITVPELMEGVDPPSDGRRGGEP